MANLGKFSVGTSMSWHEVEDWVESDGDVNGF